MTKAVGFLLLFVGMSSFALAAVPEVSVGAAGSAIALVSGAVLVIRGRRKNKK
jgi:membrane associated rhomboid family serine protease